MLALNQSLRLTLKVLASVFVLFIVSIMIILVTVDPNDYREDITAAVKEHTGRDFEVEKMSLSIFPRLAINLENASLSNATGFNDKPFFKADKVQVGAAMLPLLSQELEVEKLTLHGLSLNLEKNANGNNNWNDLIQSEQGTDSKGHEENSESGSPLTSLNFGGIDIQNGEILWSDQQNSQNVSLKEVNIQSGSIRFGSFFDLKLSAKADVSQPKIQSNLTLSLEAKIEQNGQYDLKNLRLENQFSSQNMPIEVANTVIELPSFNLTNNELSLPSLLVKFDVTGGKDLPIKQSQGQIDLTNLTANLDKQSFRLSALKLQSDLEGDVIPNKKTSIELSTHLDLDLKQESAILKNITLKTENMALNASVKATQIIANPQVDTELKISQTNLRDLLERLNIALPQMSNQSSLQTFALSTQVKFAKQAESIQINNLKVTLDDSNLSGKASIKNFANPAIAYNLNLDKIDINRYLPPKQAETPVSESPTKTEEDAKIELPVEMLRKLKIDGTFKAGSVKFDNLNPTNLLVATKANKGDIYVSPIKATLFKTQINASAGLNVAGKTPKYRFKTDTKDLLIGEAMIAFTGKDQLTGTGTVNLNITTQGERVSEFKKALNGHIYADLKNGAVKGFNLAKAIRQAKAKLSGKTLANDDSEAQTDFSALTVKANIKNGIVSTQTLSAKAPFMRINGEGTVNLPAESLNYLVKTKIVGSDKGQGGEELKDLNGLTIPVKLTGRYISPSVSLDLNSLIEQKTKAKIEEKKEEVVKDIKKQAEEKLKDSLFKGLKF